MVTVLFAEKKEQNLWPKCLTTFLLSVSHEVMALLNSAFKTRLFNVHVDYLTKQKIKGFTSKQGNYIKTKIAKKHLSGSWHFPMHSAVNHSDYHSDWCPLPPAPKLWCQCLHLLKTGQKRIITNKTTLRAAKKEWKKQIARSPAHSQVISDRGRIWYLNT